MNLVVGATGTLGTEICRFMRSEGRPMRALVRSASDPTKVAKLEGLGVQVVRGDMKERQSLDAACRGISAVLSTASSFVSRQEGDSIRSVDLEGQVSLIEAAEAAGVHHFVFVSFPPIEIEFPLQSAKRAVERRLKDGEMTYTVLQPTFFTEAWLSSSLGFDAAGATVRLYGTGENKISWISYRDVARFVAASVDNPAARNAVIKLGGPEALSPREVVRIFEAIAGRRFDIKCVPEDSLRTQQQTATDAFQQSSAALVLYYARGEVIDMQETLRKFPGRLVSVREYARAGA